MIGRAINGKALGQIWPKFSRGLQQDVLNTAGGAAKDHGEH